MIELVLASGFFTLYIIVALLFFLIVFRYWNANKIKRESAYIQSWKRSFASIQLGKYCTYPSISSNKERFLFIDTWLKEAQELNASEKEKMLAFAKQAWVKKEIFNLLSDERLAYKECAINAIGVLQIRDFDINLKRCLLEKNILLSSISARTLVKIESKNIINQIVDLYVDQNAWPSRVVIQILKNSKTKLSSILVQKLKNTPENKIAKTVKLLALVDEQFAYNQAKSLLETYDSPEIMAASIYYVNKKEDKNLLKQFIRHKSWKVRLAAATSLESMLSNKDINSFALLLSDKKWKIRNHIADALVSKEFANKEYLDTLSSSMVDPKAQSALLTARKRAKS